MRQPEQMMATTDRIKEEIRKPQSMTLVMIREAFYNAVFWVKIIDRLESELKRYGIRMSIFIADDATDPCEIQENCKTDGYIVMGLVSSKVLEGLEKHGLPIILLDHKYIDTSHDHIRINNRLGMKRMVSRILELGHRSMLFMGDMDFAASYRERFTGAMEALNDHPEMDPVIRHVLIQNGLKSIEERDAFLKAIRSEDPPTVLIGANDMISLEAIEVLKKAGIRVPEDISVVGFDNISEANFAEPKLTTVDVSKIDLAVVTVETILRKYEQPERPNMLIMIEPKLIERNSLVERRT